MLYGGVVELLAGEIAFRLCRLNWRHADIRQSHAGMFASTAVVECDLNGHARGCEVADFSFELEIRASAARRWKRDLDLGQDLLRFECGSEETWKKVFNPDLALSFRPGCNYSRSECQHCCRMIVRWIAVSEIAADSRLAAHERTFAVSLRIGNFVFTTSDDSSSCSRVSAPMRR